MPTPRMSVSRTTAASLALALAVSIAGLVGAPLPARAGSLSVQQPVVTRSGSSAMCRLEAEGSAPIRIGWQFRNPGDGAWQPIRPPAVITDSGTRSTLRVDLSLASLSAEIRAIGLWRSTATGGFAWTSTPVSLERCFGTSTRETKADLQELADIAAAYGGNRASGTPGYDASLWWVHQHLIAAGYRTTIQSFDVHGHRSYNLIAEWPQGDPAHVVMAGAHLDSVSRGPGVNDNASGSAVLLRVALEHAMSGVTPRNRLRFAWWGSEEPGSFGSRHYVRTLPPADRASIEGYFNLDMVASPNPGYFVYDWKPDNGVLRSYLGSWFTTRGIPWEYVDVGGYSDHGSFLEVGIPAIGITTGADWSKTTSQASLWGGTAGVWFDPCYHRACDTMANVNLLALDRSLAVTRDFVSAFAHHPW